MLGPRIASLRQTYGLSQAELARRLHISASAIGMYEQGRREPSADTLVALAGLFGVTTDYLLTGKPTLPSDRQVVDRVLRASIESAQIMLGSRSRQPFTAQELSALYESLLTNP